MKGDLINEVLRKEGEKWEERILDHFRERGVPIFDCRYVQSSPPLPFVLDS